MRTTQIRLLLLLTVCVGAAEDLLAATTNHPGLASARGGIPIIEVTDLYHPPQDSGDNFDLLAAFALPEVDLKAVILGMECGPRPQRNRLPAAQPIARGPLPLRR